MRYFTAEELRDSHQRHAHEIVGAYTGRSVRDALAIDVFDTTVKNLGIPVGTMKVLDLGPARGVFAGQLIEHGYKKVYGFDIDEYLDPTYRSLFQEFHTGDLSQDELPWPDNYFHAVSAWCVLPHLENPFHCIREVYRVLEPGGIFIATVPHLGARASIAYFRRHKDFRSYRSSNNHITLFPPGVMEKAVFRYFEVVDIRYHVRPKIFKNGMRGKLRHAVYMLTKKFLPRRAVYWEERWASNIVYILEKKPLDGHGARP